MAMQQEFDFALRPPDALRLAIARRLDATLVTLDRRLINTARELGVAVEELGASGPDTRSEHG
jgi:predicted nucleic acid-binding protein